MTTSRLFSTLATALLLMTSLLSAATAHAAGGYVGNGGDGIECRKDAANRFDGIYALDYLVTLPTIQADDGLRAVSSWQVSQTRILWMLRNKVPSLAQSFEHFSKLIYNTSFTQDRVWEPSPFGLVPLDDQRLTSLLPENCKDNKANPNIIQAVIRLYEGYSGTVPGHIVYKYDPTFLDKLDKQAPLQLSFLFVHEWLWDVSPNVERNRRVNRFLHSRAAEALSPADMIAELKGMGLTIPEVQSDEFNEASCQGYPLTEKEVTDRFPGTNVMANWGQVTVSRRERAAGCTTYNPDCNLNWVKPRFKSPIIEGYPFFLSPSWRYGRPAGTIQLMSPQYHAQEKRPLLSGTGEISCRFVNDPVMNLECSIATSNLEHAFWDEDHMYEGDFTKLPKIKAKLTQECFWMKSSGSHSMDWMGSQGTKPQPFEQEIVLSVHATGGLFIKPRP